MLIRYSDDTSDSALNASKKKKHQLLLQTDGMGFCMSDISIEAGASMEVYCSDHEEAVFCFEGEGELVNLKNDDSYRVTAGTLYALEYEDEHKLNAETDMRMLCVAKAVSESNSSPKVPSLLADLYKLFG